MSPIALAEQVSPRPVASPPNLPALGRPPGVLVVDDEAAIRRPLERGLKRRGFAVWIAADGEAAVEIYRWFACQIDVVLSDVNMPGMGGPAALAALGEIDPAVRFCFMTGDVRPATLAGLLGLGALRVFTKPFSSIDEVAAELGELSTVSVTGRRAP